MFTRDQREIGQYAQASPDAMARVITFVYLTIQQSIFDMPQYMRHVDRHGTDSPYLWGFKIDAYDWLHANKDDVYRLAMDTRYGYADPIVCEDECLKMWAAMPGLGLVKGGFCNQLIFGMSGCIDTHNNAIFEVDPNRFKATRFKNGSGKLRQRLARDYNYLCDDIGGPEFLWDNWCGYVADRNHTTADAVSRLHVQAIME